MAGKPVELHLYSQPLPNASLTSDHHKSSPQYFWDRCPRAHISLMIFDKGEEFEQYRDSKETGSSEQCVWDKGEKGLWTDWGRQGEASQAVCDDTWAMRSHWRMWRKGSLPESHWRSWHYKRDFPTQARTPCFPQISFSSLCGLRRGCFLLR